MPSIFTPFAAVVVDALAFPSPHPGTRWVLPPHPGTRWVPSLSRQGRGGDALVTLLFSAPPPL